MNKTEMTSNPSTSIASLPTFRSLEEIQIRKAMLLKDIQKDSKTIDEQWHSLFHRPVALKADATPSKRFGSILSTGASLLDAFVLGFKLYRKFKK